MATELPILNHGTLAAADLSAKQYFGVKLSSSSGYAVCTTAGEQATGILQNDPESGEHCSVMLLGLSKASAGGTISYMDPLTVDASSEIVKADEATDFVIGFAMESAVDGDIFQMFVFPAGQVASTADVDALVSSANYSSAGQYTAVKPHTTAGQIVRCSVAGEAAMGILTNAPAASATALVKTHGVTTFKAGTGGVTAGDKLACEADGELVTASGDAFIIGYALATVSAGSTGLMFVDPAGLYSVDGVTLADGKIWVGNGSNEAAAVTMSGDGTISNAGVLTVTGLATTSAGDASGDLIYRDAAATFERLAKGTAAQILAMNGAATAPEWIAQSAMTVGAATTATTAATATNVATTAAGDAIGDLLYRDAAATLERLAVGAPGAVLQVNAGATAPQWAALSSDVTIADGGAVTIANEAVTAAKMGSAAQGTIFRGDAANAVSELNLADGKIAVGDGTDVAAVSAKTSGRILVGNGTTLASVAVAGDATLVAAGTLTLDKSLIRKKAISANSAAVVAMNANPIVILDHSAMITAGEIATDDILIFHGAVLQLNGGAAAYDTNQNTIAKYQTAGGGASVSLTLANFFNAGADGKVSTLKPIATDLAPEINEDIVLTSSASPFTAGGDRALAGYVYYSVYTPV